MPRHPFATLPALTEPSRLKQRALDGDAPPPGTRVYVARIQGEAASEEAAAVSRMLVGMHGQIVEATEEDSETAPLVKLDEVNAPVHFGWDELELEAELDYGERESGDKDGETDGASH